MRRRSLIILLPLALLGISSHFFGALDAIPITAVPGPNVNSARPASAARLATNAPHTAAAPADILSPASIRNPVATAPPAADPVPAGWQRRNARRQLLAARREFFPEAPAGVIDRDNLWTHTSTLEKGTPTEERALASERFTFDHFIDWVHGYIGEDDPKARSVLLSEGLIRAALRRPILLELIERDPEAALEHAVPLHLRALLPDEIRGLIETPFSTQATVLRRHHHMAPGASQPSHKLLMREVAEPLACYTYGRRTLLPSKVNCPVQGFYLDGKAVLREDVLQALDPAEIGAADELYETTTGDWTRCFASGRKIVGDPVIGLSGGRLFRFRDRKILDDFNTRVATLDNLPGEQAGSQALFLAQPERAIVYGFDFTAAKAALAK